MESTLKRVIQTITLEWKSTLKIVESTLKSVIQTPILWSRFHYCERGFPLQIEDLNPNMTPKRVDFHSTTLIREDETTASEKGNSRPDEPLLPCHNSNIPQCPRAKGPYVVVVFKTAIHIYNTMQCYATFFIHCWFFFLFSFLSLMAQYHSKLTSPTLFDPDLAYCHSIDLWNFIVYQYEV